MTLDKIIAMTDRQATLYALANCSTDDAYKWRKAWFEACKDVKVSIAAISWLNDQARREGGRRDQV
jgi:hypothetical protein